MTFYTLFGMPRNTGCLSCLWRSYVLSFTGRHQLAATRVKTLNASDVEIAKLREGFTIMQWARFHDLTPSTFQPTIQLGIASDGVRPVRTAHAARVFRDRGVPRPGCNRILCNRSRGSMEALNSPVVLARLSQPWRIWALTGTITPCRGIGRMALSTGTLMACSSPHRQRARAKRSSTTTSIGLTQ